ncbi:hypothetical protein D3C72_1447060 [compost metagenome]
MKKYLVALAVLSVTGLSSCIRCVKMKYVTVVKDCTGVYLRDQQKDYQVCNYEMLDAYHNGASVQAQYGTIGSCPALDTVVVCEMLHPSEGLVEIYSVE